MARRSGVAETLVERARDAARGWYRVRWAVEGRACRKPYAVEAVADAVRDTLKRRRPQRHAVRLWRRPGSGGGETEPQSERA